MGRDSKGAQPRWDLGELLNAGAGVARSIRKTKEATLCITPHAATPKVCRYQTTQQPQAFSVYTSKVDASTRMKGSAGFRVSGCKHPLQAPVNERGRVVAMTEK